MLMGGLVIPVCVHKTREKTMMMMMTTPLYEIFRYLLTVMQIQGGKLNRPIRMRWTERDANCNLIVGPIFQKHLTFLECLNSKLHIADHNFSNIFKDHEDYLCRLLKICLKIFKELLIGFLNYLCLWIGPILSKATN